MKRLAIFLSCIFASSCFASITQVTNVPVAINPSSTSNVWAFIPLNGSLGMSTFVTSYEYTNATTNGVLILNWYASLSPSTNGCTSFYTQTVGNAPNTTNLNRFFNAYTNYLGYNYLILKSIQNTDTNTISFGLGLTNNIAYGSNGVTCVQP